MTQEELKSLKFGDKIYKSTHLGLQTCYFIAFEPIFEYNQLLNPNGEYLESDFLYLIVQTTNKEVIRVHALTSLLDLSEEKAKAKQKEICILIKYNL